MVWFNYRGNSLVADEFAITGADGRYLLKNVPGAGFRYTWMNPKAEVGAVGNAELLADDLRPDSNLVGRLEKIIIQARRQKTVDLKLESGLVLGGRVVNLTTGQPIPKMRFMCGINDKYEDLYADETGKFRVVVPPTARSGCSGNPITGTPVISSTKPGATRGITRPMRGS